MRRLLVDLHHASVPCWRADERVLEVLRQESEWDIVVLPPAAEQPEARQALVEAGATALWTWFADAHELAQCPGLAWVATPAAGADYLPVTELRERGMLVTCSHGHHGPAMAEHAWGMALSLARDGHRSWRERGDWDGWRQQLSQRAVPIYGSTCLLLGYGGIGRHLAAIGHAFGAKCVALRQQATTAAASETEVRMVTQAQLPEVLPEVRLVLNSLPGGAQTRHLIDARFLAALPAPAIIVNVGRGSTIDQAALLTAIRSGRVRAGLDVFAHEPLVPSSPLWEEAEVVLTPHAAAITSDYLVRGAAQQRQQMQRFVTGQPLLWQAADEGAPIRL